MNKIIILLFVFLSFVSFSQNITNSTDTNSVLNREYILEKDNPIVARLDSLIALHIRIGTNFNDSIYNKLDSIPQFHDSIIKQRLTLLDNNTPFEFNYNSISKSYINMYLKRRKSISIFLARKELYFPIFEELLLKYKLPIELKYLPIVESALKPTAESWAGAAGLWQFMYNTGKIYGLEADSYLDYRKDPYKSTEAACKHLSKLYKVYENWELVLAAYNAGSGNVNKAIRRSGGKKNYWEIYKYLPKETRGYVPAFIGVNYAMNYASEHNIYSQKPLVTYSQIDTIHVSRRVDLKLVAKFFNLSLEHLTNINPTYSHAIIPDKKENQCLYIPKEKIGLFYANEIAIYEGSEELKKVYKITENSYIKGKGRKIRYKVKKGDYLGKIARKHKVKVKQIKKWNNLRGTNLKIGQRLTIYVKK